jgi:DNA-binding GntR family transcriptional regulator
VDFVLPEDARVPSASAAEQVVATLRRLIVEGAIPPAARLREAQLAAGFEVSRQTVREAIRELVHDGLAHHDRHRGAVVVDLGPDDVADIYVVRRTLEVAGAERVHVAADAAVDEVGEALARLAAIAPSGTWAEVTRADMGFHRSVVALAGSPRLVRAFDAIAGELTFCMSVLRQVGQEERVPAAIVADHRGIAEAVAARDSELARVRVSEHIELYAARLTQALGGRRETLVQT